MVIGCTGIQTLPRELHHLQPLKHMLFLKQIQKIKFLTNGLLGF
jgi:hypothetical protein